MQIKILYFAQLADLAEKTEEQVHIIESTPEALYTTLCKKYHFPLSFEQIQVAVNHKLSAHHTPLTDGDTIAFLPPMTGG